MSRYSQMTKEERNQKDFQVLIIGVISLVVLQTFLPLTISLYDRLFINRPFVSASIELKEDSNGEFKVYYDADAVIETDATWIAYGILQRNNERVFTRRGQGSYSTKIDEPKPWSWDAFFDTESGLPSPDIPKETFKVCLRYISVSRRSDLKDETPETCSNFYDPNL